MKAVIYARYSSDNQREESIEGQLRECTAYCKKNDITILRTYIDRAMSAKTDHRPDFQRMIKDSAKGLFDVIIVWKLDRFARNRYDSAHYKAQLRKYGVKVLSATENISDGPEGIILESMLEGMAEYYSAELSEKVIRGHTENALKCKYNGGTLTYGFAIDKNKCYQIDPRTAPVVLEAFTRYDKGATMKDIMDYLTENGVTTVRGRKIDLNFIARMLKNRKYIGEYSYRHIVTPGGIPAIVPQDLFDRVQKRLEANKKAPARHKAEDDYLLTTKLFCGTCGAMMVGESGTSSSKGRKYHYYRCVNTKKQKNCNAKHKSIRKLPIENAVVNAVMAKVMDDNFVEYIADAVMEIQAKESSVLPALRKQMEETERGITNMLNAIQMGIINASTKQRLDELEERKKDIELQIIQEEMKRPKLTREDVVYWICRFRSLDVSRLEERRRLIDSFVNSVTVFDDYLLITFNYKEGETRLDFADIESSDLSSVGGPGKPRASIALGFFFVSDMWSRNPKSSLFTLIASFQKLFNIRNNRLIIVKYRQAQHNHHRRNQSGRNADQFDQQRDCQHGNCQTQDIADIHAGNQSPAEFRLFCKQLRSRGQTPHHQAAQKNSSRTGAGDTQSQQRSERAGGSRIICRLRGRHAFGDTAAKVLAAFADTFIHDIA